jgi:hypothetical protein
LQKILNSKTSFKVAKNETIDSDPVEEMVGPPEMLKPEQRDMAKRTLIRKGLIKPPYYLKKDILYYEKTCSDPLHGQIMTLCNQKIVSPSRNNIKRSNFLCEPSVPNFGLGSTPMTPIRKDFFLTTQSFNSINLNSSCSVSEGESE